MNSNKFIVFNQYEQIIMLLIKIISVQLIFIC